MEPGNEKEKTRKPQNEMAVCPKCRRISEVTAGMTLAACWRCAAFGADRIETGDARESELYDWPATIDALKEAMKLTRESRLAIELGISAPDLSKVKHGLRPMPKGVLKSIRKKWPDALKAVQAVEESQATEKPQDSEKLAKKGPAARVVATTPIFAKNIPIKNSELQDQKNEVSDPFEGDLAE